MMQLTLSCSLEVLMHFSLYLVDLPHLEGQAGFANMLAANGICFPVVTTLQLLGPIAHECWVASPDTSTFQL